MSPPRRYESSDTVPIDRAALERARLAASSDNAFDDWAAAEIERALSTTSVPPPPGD